MKTKVPYCSRCKTIKNLMPKPYSTTKYKGALHRYYMCRPCNTDRHRKYTSTTQGAKKQREAVGRSIEKHFFKQVTRRKVKYAVQVGHLVKPKLCIDCSLDKVLEGHHEDYSKPLDVVWLCVQCHSTRHQVLHRV